MPELDLRQETLQAYPGKFKVLIMSLSCPPPLTFPLVLLPPSSPSLSFYLFSPVLPHLQ